MQQIIRNTGVQTSSEPPKDTDKDKDAMEKLKQYIVLAYHDEDYTGLLKKYKSVQGGIDKMDRSEVEQEFGKRFSDLV
jgi:hypothetical protein